MEEQQLPQAPQDLENFFNIAFDGVTRAHLRKAAVWAKISTLCAFVGYGVVLIVAFIGQPVYSLGSNGEGLRRTVTATSIFGALLSVGAGIFINYFLYRFAVSSIRGIDSMDSVKANEGFSSLRRYFKILGICLIIVLCLLVLVIVFAGLGAATSRF
ncbi:MAG TPA: hypothetical protein VGN00_21205 [Puia sp.]|jgi:hypothetical protein